MIFPQKKLNYICLDFEMSDLTSEMRKKIHGLTSEIIQIGAVLLDEKFNLVSSFSAFVKPQFSHVNAIIQELTGISESDIAEAKTFVPAIKEYFFWRSAYISSGAEVLTFSWSRSDFTQLKAELNFKAHGKKELYSLLDNFVDLQKTFGRLLSANTAISLNAATKFSNVSFKGKQHTALFDAYNTACILRKICFAKKLSPQFDFLGKSTVKFPCAKNKKSDFNKKSFLLKLLQKIPLRTKKSLCAKYGIPYSKFVEFRLQTFFVKNLTARAIL